MAPIPQNETKEPDKTEKTDNNNDLRTNSDFLDDLNNSVRDLDSQDSNVSTLDDGQLKALLDEAINYKTPKDREGKSRIFKVLLQQAETEERNARAASASGPQLARYYNTSARKRNKASLAPSLAASTTQGGSLQDLIAGKKPLRRKRTTGPCVSSRSREGGSLGSLPSTSAELTREDSTPQPQEAPSPRGRFQSESEKDEDKNNFFHTDDITHRIPRIRYTSRATLEVEACSGPQNPISVDKPVSFSQLEGGAPFPGAQTLQLENDYSSVRCLVDEGAQARTGALPQGSAGTGAAGALMPTQYRLLSVANPKIIHNVDKFSEKKAVDENCNSLPSNSDSKKKKKCSKVDRNVTVLKSENLPGHRADIIESIDLLVKFIEDDNNTSKNKKSLNHKLENKKRRVKKNSTNVQKSNSLEEISKSKLEDLMLDDTKSKKIKNKSISEDGEVRKFEMEDLSDDFHVVIKKKKHKKRLLAQKQVAPQSTPRLEKERRQSACSAPPSDKSDSSDLDSVHSLPTHSMGAQSYAEIARSASSSSSSSSSVSQHNYQVGPAVWKSAPMSLLNPSHFPTLPSPEEGALPPGEDQSPVGPPVATGDFAPRVRRTKIVSRPAVIILDESVGQIPGLTFGFELNPQLLGPETALEVFQRYFAPEHRHLYNHDKIVTYVGLAWEDALHDVAAQFYHSDTV